MLCFNCQLNDGKSAEYHRSVLTIKCLLKARASSESIPSKNDGVWVWWKSCDQRVAWIDISQKLAYVR